MENETKEKMTMKSKVTTPQLVAVTALTLVALAGGVVIAGLFGNFSMRPNDMQTDSQQVFSTSTIGLSDAKAQETVELKDGDTYNLTANIVKKNIDGQDIKMLAYNGSIPGPLIKVPQNGKVTINFKNDTDVKTLLHSHGVRMDNQFDGSQSTQKEMEPGESFSYKLTFPDAGIFWYHPHVREDYAQDLGLYGNYLVVPTDTSYWSPVNREVVLTLDDVLLENGKIASYSKNIVDRTLMGRFGNTMLVNGDTKYQQTANIGEVVRFYLTNTASTRVFNISIPGVQMKLVGSDGGKYTREQFVDSVIISPSERYIVEVLFDKPGNFAFQSKTPDKTYQLGKITVGGQPVTTSYGAEFTTLRQNTDIATALPNLEAFFTKKVDKSLTLSIDMKMQGDQNSMEGMDMGNMNMEGMQMGSSDTEKIEWEDTNPEMNTMSNKNMVTWKLIDNVNKKENMDINWQFKKGDLVKLKIFNDPKSAHPMQHPIHIHGQRFVVLSTNGVRNNNLVFKDTALVQKGDTVELLVQMDNPGKWLIHCHIPEHMEAGMMSEFQVN